MVTIDTTYLFRVRLHSESNNHLLCSIIKGKEQMYEKMEM